MKMKINKRNKIGIAMVIFACVCLAFNIIFGKELSKLRHNPLADILFFLPLILIIVSSFVFDYENHVKG